MGTSQRGKIQIELGRNLTDFVAMVDSGDHQVFNEGILYSGKSGYEPVIRANGITEGSKLLSPHTSNDTVAVVAFKAQSKGIVRSVAAGTQTVTRPTTEDFKISSIIMDEDGNLGEAQGAEGTEFSVTRGANGGPPLLPADAVELGWVRMSSQSPAVITREEIYQDMGQHAEYAEYPAPETFNLGKGSYAAVAAEINAHVKFNEALPLSHVDTKPKGVYVKYYTPTLTTLLNVHDFKAAELGVTKSSETMYEGSGVSGAIGSMKADSVGDVSFTVYAKDGVTDAIIRERGEMVTVKWFPDANKAPYLLSQGMLGVVRDFPSGTQNKINATVYCQSPSVEFSS
ncbi:hypothetical protein [uncultured Desulfosarcina sp.]|uniref:hypothetical protein n=1 Tax=uncultured Desulfosarcina sp. TaxID=218289 RepID=UPI0029C65B5B|nr:hypothetical protein [uncultured Desulfosarcina sp.]